LHKQEISAKVKKAIEAKGDFTRPTLDPRVPDMMVCIGAEISPQEQAELLQFLDKNSDVFAWSTSDLIAVSREVTSTNCKSTQMRSPRSRSFARSQRKK
jgi:hypothetical protein